MDFPFQGYELPKESVLFTATLSFAYIHGTTLKITNNTDI